MRSYAVSIPGEVAGSPELGDALRSHDLRNIEFSDGVAPHSGMTARYVKGLEELQKKGILRIGSLHLPFYPFSLWQFASEDEAARRETVRLTLEYMEHFARLDIRNLTIHCGGEPNLPEERRIRMEQMVRTCRDLQPVLERWDASLNLELLPRTCLGNHEDELLEMIGQLPAEHFNLCIDVNHLMGRWREIPAGQSANALLGSAVFIFPTTTAWTNVIGRSDTASSPGRKSPPKSRLSTRMY